MTCRVIVQVVPNDMPCHCTSGSEWHAVSLYKWFQMTCRVIVQVVPNDMPCHCTSGSKCF